MCCNVSHERVVRVGFAEERRDGEHDFVKRESRGPVVLENLRETVLKIRLLASCLFVAVIDVIIPLTSRPDSANKRFEGLVVDHLVLVFRN